MPTEISLEELDVLDKEIRKIKKTYPEACDEISRLINKRRNLGFRNFCRLFIGEWTPETLRSGKKEEKKNIIESI